MGEAVIVGVGCTGFRSTTPEVSYEELIFDGRAYSGFCSKVALYA